jgi:aquaporin Z
MKKAIAEFIGTFALVLIGCGTAVIAGMGTGATSVDMLGIATAFGLTIVAMAYGIGQVSGCHINPAVSFGALVAGRMSGSDFVTYVIAQVLGAIAGAFVLYLILLGKASGWSGGLGQNGWGPGYLGEYNLTAAFLYEVIGTFLFLVCILGVTQKGAPVGLAGLAIGLTLVALHLLGINITGTCVNPARSLGPAIVGFGSNPQALHRCGCSFWRRSSAPASPGTSSSPASLRPMMSFPCAARGNPTWHLAPRPRPNRQPRRLASLRPPALAPARRMARIGPRT